MIGRLRGRIEILDEERVILDVSGVGYLVFCSANSLRQVSNKQEVSLLVETHVREDHIHLYGFINEEERKLFLQLTKVNGVGNKMALAILSTLTNMQIITALNAEDKKAFTAVPGVGPKLAARIVNELKDKLAIINSGDVHNFISRNSSDSQDRAPNNSADAISALINLGYGRSDVFIAVNKLIANNENLSLDELIRNGLKELTGN